MTNFPNGVSSQGVPLIPGAPLTTGTYFFVHSGTGSDSNSGRDKTHPLATVQAAINKCTANKSDVILVMPGHAETVTATSINLSVAGVRVYGLGSGLLRPTFTYGAAAATVTVSAANCGWFNCHHIANFLNITAAFTVGAAKDFVLDSCTFVDNSSSLNFLSAIATGSTNNDADGLQVTNNYLYGLATTDAAFVSILANELRLNVSNNVVDKAATNDAGHFITLSSKDVKGARIIGNILTVVGSAGAAAGVFLTGSGTASSGIVSDNYVFSLDTTSALIASTGTGLRFLQNFYSGAADASGAVWPVADNPA